MKFFSLIDPRLSDKAVKKLKQLEIEPIPVPCTHLVDTPISGHPDIQVFLHRGKAFIHPDISIDFYRKLNRYCDIRICTTHLSETYPHDVAYNISVAGIHAFHKKNATDPIIKEYLLNNLISINEVKQGYSGCSTLVVNEQSIITSDKSINLTAETIGLDSLLISPGYFILPGYKYGFIGGASGRFINNILFTGSIDHHPDRNKIFNFIGARGLDIIFLSDAPAVDTGSLMISSY